MWWRGNYVHILLAICLIYGIFITGTNAVVEPVPMPDVLKNCYIFRMQHFNIFETPTQQINSFCITKFLYETANQRYQRPIANETILYAQELFRQLIGEATQNRKKRQATTPRVRREVRTMTRAQWNRYTRRINALKEEMIRPGLSRYDAIADIHRLVITSAHDGPAFLGWHTVYLLVYEIALGVGVPYWDSRLDFYMRDPTESVLWGPRFFGNGFGAVNTGPFANWTTPEGVPLTRNIGNDGSLISEGGVRAVLSQTSHADIVEPNPVAANSLEAHHNAPHVWVDGQLSAPSTAAQDPVFFMHHSFIDYIWRQFKDNLRAQGTNPFRDYPPTTVPQHGPFDRMIPWRFRNRDGYRDYFETFATFEDSPTCPDCGGSNFLSCMQGRCVSDRRPTRTAGMGGMGGAAAFGRSFAFSGAQELTPAEQVRMTIAETGPLPIGQRFRSRFVDPRTRSDSMPSGPARVIRSVTGPHENRSMVNLTNSQLDNEYTNTFVIDGVADMKRWAFIPVRVLFKQKQKSSVSMLKKGSLGVPVANPSGHVTSEQAKYPRCHTSGSKAPKVFVQADGIDYSGRFKDYVTLHENRVVSSAITYIGVKNPRNATIHAYITAYDTCGRVCRIRCLKDEEKYGPCSGAFRVSTEKPMMYGDTQQDAVLNLWTLNGQILSDVKQKAVPIVFVCDFNNRWPWFF